jgi:hypothetical protein
MPANLLPQTALLSNELCHVGLPNGSGDGATELGLVSGLRKCVRICWLKVPIVMNKVACGLDETTVQEAPNPEGRQMYPCVPTAWPIRNGTFPDGGVMAAGVGGGVTPLADIGGATPKVHARAMAGTAGPNEPFRRALM